MTSNGRSAQTIIEEAVANHPAVKAERASGADLRMPFAKTAASRLHRRAARWFHMNGADLAAALHILKTYTAVVYDDNEGEAVAA